MLLRRTDFDSRPDLRLVFCNPSCDRGTSSSSAIEIINGSSALEKTTLWPEEKRAKKTLIISCMCEISPS
jgi:hypothetical protein